MGPKVEALSSPDVVSARVQARATGACVEVLSECLVLGTSKGSGLATVACLVVVEDGGVRGKPWFVDAASLGVTS